MRTLIVEDEQVNSEILHGFLSEYGECIQVYDGSEAINAFEEALQSENPFDLICMDIMMPNVDGQEALQRIRSLEKKKGISRINKVNVIMTTALEDQKNVIESFYKGGAAAYINKPIEKEMLLNEVRKLARK